MSTGSLTYFRAYELAYSRLVVLAISSTALTAQARADNVEILPLAYRWEINQECKTNALFTLSARERSGSR